MKNKKVTLLNFLSVVTIGLIITGCTSYNLEPNYDDKKSELTINNLHLASMNENINEFPPNKGEGIFVENNREYSSTTNSCTNLHYSSLSAGNMSYIWNSTKEQLVENKNLECKATNIANLYFFTCAVKNTNRTIYNINTSTPNSHGYGSDASISNINAQCFNTIKDHFTSLANKDDIKIKELSY